MGDMHTLACALYCNPDGGLNGLGTFMAGVFEVGLGAVVALGVLAALGSVLRGPKGRRR